MAVNSVLAPYPSFFDATGAPLENGFIYIGEPGFEARTTPKASYFAFDPLAIPTGTASGAAIRTSGGFPVNGSGAPAMFYVDGDFSISVTDRNGVLLYSALNNTLALNVGATVGPVLWADGSLGAVGGGFVNEPNTGFVRPSANTMQTVVGGVLVATQTTTGVVFAQPVSGAGFDSGVLAIAQPLDADLTAIAALSSTGIAVRTAGNTWAQRQLTSADGSVTFTNPAGVAGDIDLSVAAKRVYVAPVSVTAVTSVDIATSLPAGVNEFDVAVDGVSSTTGNPVIQLGTAGSYVTSGYVGGSGGDGSLISNGTEGGMAMRIGANGRVYYAQMTCRRVSGDTWVCGHTIADSGNAHVGAGRIVLGGTLTRVRITQTGTFTAAGSVSLSYST